MSNKLLSHLEDRLKDRRRHLLKDINLRLREFNGSRDCVVTDTADIASNHVERDIIMSIAQGEARKINQIDKALKRIEKGKYGVCKCCNNSINKERLMAIPFTSLCVKCKEDEERYEGAELDRGGYGLGTIEFAGVEADDEKRDNTKNYNINPYDN